MIDHGVDHLFCFREPKYLFHEFIKLRLGQIFCFRRVVLDHATLDNEAVRSIFSLLGRKIRDHVFRPDHLMVELFLLVFEFFDLLVVFFELTHKLCPLLGERFRFRHWFVLLENVMGIKNAGA